MSYPPWWTYGAIHPQTSRWASVYPEEVCACHSVRIGACTLWRCTRLCPLGPRERVAPLRCKAWIEERALELRLSTPGEIDARGLERG